MRTNKLCTSFGLKTVTDVGSGLAVKSSSGVLADCIVYTDGTNEATLIAYDNASAASGIVLAKVIVLGADKMGGEIDIEVAASNGIFITLTGTGSSCLIRYK